MIVVVKIVILLIVAFMVVDFALVVVYHNKKKRLTDNKTLDSNICESANGVKNCAPTVNHKKLIETTLTDK